jgi:MoaA/NifB/PqqE/SkfB family radical SAM enzyme
MDNVLMLRDKGFPLTISEVAYPFISDKVESYREIFRKKGLKLVFNAFRGIWNSREYPAAYTKEEIRLFDLKEIPEFRPDIFNRKGLFCNAGYNSVIILENGDAYPCYMLEMPENKLGNIYTDLKLNRGMTKCPSKFCTCPFPAFESDLYDKALTETKTGKIKILSNWITARIGGFSRGKF